MNRLFSSIVALSVPLAAARADLGGTGEGISGNPLPSNVASPRVIAELARRFDIAKAPVSNGDLFLGSRWMCRELFAESDGYSTYRFKSIRLALYEGGILEDELNASPRFYVYGHDGLVGASSQKGGETTELRLDPDGNLRLAARDNAGHVRSYTVCLARNRSEH